MFLSKTPLSFLYMAIVVFLGRAIWYQSFFPYDSCHTFLTSILSFQGILKAKGSSNGKAPKNHMLKTKGGHDKSSKAPKNHTLESKVGSDDSTRLPQHCMLKAKGGHDKSSKTPKNHMLKAKGGHDKSSKAPKNHILQVKGGKDDSTKASNNHILKAKGEIDGSAKAPKNHILMVKGESRDSTELTSRKRSSPFTEGSKPLLKASLIAEDNAGDPVNHFRSQNLLRVSYLLVQVFRQLNFQGLKCISITQRIYSLQEERYHQFRWERCSKKFHSLSLL